MRSLFIDSGQHTGVAGFEGDRLAFVALNNTPAATGHDLVVFELPVVGRTGKRGAINPNAIILTAARGGWAAGCSRAAEVRYVTPEQWKGQLPKDVTEDRAREALTVGPEWHVIDHDMANIPIGLRNNVWDAVAMGLVWHGRIKGMRIRGSKPLFGGGK